RGLDLYPTRGRTSRGVVPSALGRKRAAQPGWRSGRAADARADAGYAGPSYGRAARAKKVQSMMISSIAKEVEIDGWCEAGEGSGPEQPSPQSSPGRPVGEFPPRGVRSIGPQEEGRRGGESVASRPPTRIPVLPSPRAGCGKSARPGSTSGEWKRGFE